MAEKLHVSKSTIYNEIKRGTINGVYDPKYSERKRSESRSGSMFDKNPELALYISRLIIEEHMSPEMIIKQLKNEPDKFEKYPTSPTTIYSAIEDGGIPGVSKEQLNLMQNMNVGYYEKEKYFPDTGQSVYETNRKKCRMPKKIEKCRAFISYVEEQVSKYKRSFAAIRAEVLDKKLFKKDAICSIGTLYTYTDRNWLRIKNIDLTEKVGRKHKKKVVLRRHKRLQGTSIVERPDKVNTREEFGHWEIDLVIGKKKSEDNVLLTLSERKTKKEIIRKIKGKTVEAVHHCLKKIKKETRNFHKIFKSITTDNGSEFARLHELGKRLGVDVYYAHPYSSWMSI